MMFFVLIDTSQFATENLFCVIFSVYHLKVIHTRANGSTTAVLFTKVVVDEIDLGTIRNERRIKRIVGRCV